MGSGYMSTDLTLGVLVPASSVRPADGHSPPQDPQEKARRHSREKEETQDDDGGDGSTETLESGAHQLDDLA